MVVEIIYEIQNKEGYGKVLIREDNCLRYYRIVKGVPIFMRQIVDFKVFK